MKKIAGVLAVLTAAAALTVPAMARDRDDYNCAPANNYGAYNTYNGYESYQTYGYPVTGSYAVGRQGGHNRNDNRDRGNRDRGRVGNEHRDAGYSRGDHARR